MRFGTHNDTCIETVLSKLKKTSHKASEETHKTMNKVHVIQTSCRIITKLQIQSCQYLMVDASSNNLSNYIHIFDKICLPILLNLEG